MGLIECGFVLSLLCNNDNTISVSSSRSMQELNSHLEMWTNINRNMYIGRHLFVLIQVEIKLTSFNVLSFNSTKTLECRVFLYTFTHINCR